jgi:hypothetical protein
MRGFANLLVMRRSFSEFIAFLKREKRWWLAPMIVLVLIVAALIYFGSGSALSPNMYR